MILKDKTYNVLKWICLILIPAVCTLLGVVLPIIGASQEMTSAAVTILTAVATFIGTLIGISNGNYYKKEDSDDSN